MDFTYQERNILSELIDLCSQSLFNAMKYIYAISDDDYYNVNVKDVFKVALSDISNPNILDNIGIQLDNAKLGEMNSLEFKRIKSLIHYAFLIRLPFIKNSMENCPLKDNHIRELLNLGIKRGAENYSDLIEDDVRSYQKMIKNKQPEPAFDSEWFRRWVYTYGKDLAAINNRNMFLFGCMEALFPLFYAALSEKITSMITKWQLANRK